MKHWLKLAASLLFIVSLNAVSQALSQDGINPRAVEDIKAFVAKGEEGDTLFNQKKYADSAAALAAAHALYQRAERRDSGATSYKITLKPETFPALRYYGYGMGPNASITELVAGAIEGSAAGLHSALIHMWQDASILGGTATLPLAGAFNDPPLVELTEDRLNSIIGTLYGPVSSMKLPVEDREWRNVVLQSRRAQLMVEYALQKYPEWKTGTRAWSRDNNKLQHTGDEALADIRAKLAEAEPEYQKLVADFRKAVPVRVTEFIREVLEPLDKAISGVKRNGWLDWNLARDIYITKDYLAERRQVMQKLYTAEGKTLPADGLKPIVEKVGELKKTIEQNAARWRFPTGKPQNAAIEARARAGVKARFPGATILRTALDSTDWTIAKNDLGIPRYRRRHVLVLMRFPGQKWHWLISGPFDQNYAGGGTYNSGGAFDTFWFARIQVAN